MGGKAVIVKVLERFYWQLAEDTMMSTKGERKRKHKKNKLERCAKEAKAREQIREVNFPSSSADG